mmetsp:Transcript_468/g.1130  ORF Transcript_468/g.1130 Transcript_468/m.1130 type:complete len:320 (+) Transcript_468:201-1160(+)|eukprot:CAMPEP_0116822252 /NCGR_PEP_ID=MMETSP0418-20121206/166_1 /TAXON_ID=1158023 /ORGANISM="Astrosyne radiata, Strain 13vi08-1A" /LENGTH=319 /DNA_ID=CAMNT_0004450347 /DNA_START=17 /DNA_END=976 /DNA_ORIENTATION=+
MSRRVTRRSAQAMRDPDDDDVMLEEEEEEESQSQDFSFSQQAPELSQSIGPAKASERNNLERMSEENKNKAVTDLSRLVLFRALAGEPLDRLKCAKDANISGERITSAAFEAVAQRLRNVFGWDLVRAPPHMMEWLPARFKDRLYVINRVDNDTTGNHSRALHGVHQSHSVEKGFLMVVLALLFCKGEARADGSRWISETELYRLLHTLDESLPKDPPSSTKRTASSQPVQGSSPNPDALMERFVAMDYLYRDKVIETDSASQRDREKVLYAMGPRAALEVGRKQVIYFCAEILDEEPDPTMLAELEEEGFEEEEVMEG